MTGIVNYKFIVCGGDSYEGYRLPEFATDSIEKAKTYIFNERNSPRKASSPDWYSVVDLETLEEVIQIDRNSNTISI